MFLYIYIYIYDDDDDDDKEQDHKQYTDKKIATIGGLGENICHIIMFY